MTVTQLISDLQKNVFKPLYWLEGEEEYAIDQVLDYAEQQILPPAESSFNLHLFYGRDTDWATILNACMRYPMFAEKQVVILKEAQSMKDLQKLEPYLNKPLSSTLLFIAYKGKRVDKRTKLAKTLKEKGVMLTTRKLYENELPDWTNALVKSKGLTISNKALHLLIDHIGNDLSRISNEIDKIIINLETRKEITEDDIEKYVGISKEYNVFELQDALMKRDLYKAMRIAQYFESNPKSAPIQLVLPSLYNFFSKIQMINTTSSGNEKTLAFSIGVPEFKIKDYIQAAKRYSILLVERNILLLHQYNLRSVGIDDAGTSDGLLLKELLVKMINN